ncbi:MAG TPA: energy transducer TonB [Candidatus Krumholzibacteria bacterium]|nr:energy transducer TonB [Candidatus Krumholzibacteria bacterium]
METRPLIRFLGVSTALHAVAGALAIAFVSIGEGDGAAVQPTVEVTLVAMADEVAATVSLTAATSSHASEAVAEVPAATPFAPIDAPTTSARSEAVDDHGTADTVASPQPRIADSGTGGAGSPPAIVLGTDPAAAGVAGAGGGGDDTSVWAWLERHKRYPRAALQRRLEGEVTLDLVLDGSGRVHEARIVRSSGHRSLDDEVTRMVARADPFPIAGAESREYRIVIEFHLEDP